MASLSADQTFSIRGVDVRFPFTPYACQLSYMESVIAALQTSQNALLESPTGTGKTLCLLCATLSWRESLRDELLAKVEKAADEQKKLDARPVEEITTARKLRADAQLLAAEKASVTLPTIIYASRTHSQLKQVIGELKRTSYAKGLKTTVLSSRQQTCRHRVVQKIEGSALKMGCKSLVSKRACKWYNNTEQYLNGRDDEDSNGKGNSSNSVLDIEDLIKIGEHKTVCPYFVSRGLVSKADIIFLPYNYLIDPKTRSGLGINWEDAVVIFDEAHNIESVCSGSASFDLPVSIVGGSVEELGTAVEIMRSAGNVSSGDLQTIDNMRGMQLVLKKLENIMSSYDNSVTKPGEFIVELFRDLQLNEQSWGTFSGVIDVAIDVLTEDALDSHNPSRMTTTRLSMLRDCLGKVFSSPIAERDFSGYRVHIHKEKQRSPNGMSLPTLSFWCFDPGEGMEALRDGNMNIRSILLTSGTLSPMSSFANELRTDFPIRLENPHVIDKKQVWIGVVPKGPGGAVLNSSYKTRSDDRYLTDLGNSIINFCRMIPDGILVFFPSYSVMSQCIDDWKTKGIWERLGQYKGLVIEPTNSAKFAAAADEYQKRLESPEYNGAAFFGVCRGKASEGLDFSDRAGRAVIICGIPFANAVDPKVKLKKEVLNSKLLARKNEDKKHGGKENNNANSTNDELISGDTWYVQQAMRAVNQAIGRVIRHKDDFGAIILCEERFGQSRHINQLSKWLRDDVVTHAAYGQATKSLDDFFRTQRPVSGGVSSRVREPQKRKDAFAQVGAAPLVERESGDFLPTNPSTGHPPAPVNLVPISMPNMMMDAKNAKGSAASSSIDSLLVGCKGKGTQESASSLSMSMDDASKNRAAKGNSFNKPWLMHGVKDGHKTTRPRSLGLSVAKVPRPMPQTRVGPQRPMKRLDVGNLDSGCGPKHLKLPQMMREAPQKQENVQSRNVEVKKPSSATTLVAELKSQLGETGFNEISTALRAYSRDKQIDPLIEKASRLLCDYDSLSVQFRDRIPAEHRASYDARIQRERRLRMD